MRVLEQSHEIGLGGFLQGEQSGALESQLRLEGLGDFSNHSLERTSTNQQFRRALVPANFTETHGSGTKSMGFHGARLSFFRGQRLSLRLSLLEENGLARSCFDASHLFFLSFFGLFSFSVDEFNFENKGSKKKQKGKKEQVKGCMSAWLL